MKKLTEAWLKAAEDDLHVIERIGREENLTHMVAFHAQQAIEKSLKAVIEEHELGSVKIHNLERLFEIAKDFAKVDADLSISKCWTNFTWMPGIPAISDSCRMGCPPWPCRKIHCLCSQSP